MSPSLSNTRKKLLLTICSDFSALSLISLILPKSCWMAFWASSRAWKGNKVRAERKPAFSFHLLRNTELLPTAPGLEQGRGAVFLQRKYRQHVKSQCTMLGYLTWVDQGFSIHFTIMLWQNLIEIFYESTSVIRSMNRFKVTAINFDALSVEKYVELTPDQYILRAGKWNLHKISSSSLILN